MRKNTLICACIAIIVGLYFMLSSNFPELGEIKPRKVDGLLIFDIDHKDTSGLLELYIHELESENICWEVRLNYFYKSKLLYGEIPQEFLTENGVTNSAVQVFPEKSVPPLNLLEGKIYKIQAVWQYDKGFSAMAGSTIQYFLIKNEVVTLLTPVL